MLGHIELLSIIKSGLQLPNGQVNFTATLLATNKEDVLVVIERIKEDPLRPFSIEYIDKIGIQYEINGRVINPLEISFESYYKLRIENYLKNIIS